MIRPWFYDKFICIADKCTDNCCAGWEIDIDPPAWERFRKVPGEFGERLRSAIHERDGQKTFALASGDRCALLREDGLCELILHCGDGILCDICALHPRFFNNSGKVREGGLGLCCEEVCRLLFSSSEPFTLVQDEEDAELQRSDDEITASFRNERRQLFQILQDRTLGITDRLGKCAEYAWNIQQQIEGGAPAEIPQDWQCLATPEELSRLLDTLAEMESINDEWTSVLARLTERRDELLDRLPEFLALHGEWRYEHIAVYGIFRHYTESLNDSAAYARVMLACCSALAVMLTDCMKWLDRPDNSAISEWDMILDLKLYSKQVEYSQENIDAFLEEYY
mgnify:FL=1